MRFTPAIAVAIMTALLLAPVAKAQQAKAERIEEPERIEEVVVVVGSRFHNSALGSGGDRTCRHSVGG